MAKFLALHSLLASRTAEGTRLLLAKAARYRQHWAMWLLKNYLFLRMPLFRPDRWLDRVYPRLAWLFSPAFRNTVDRAGAARALPRGAALGRLRRHLQLPFLDRGRGLLRHRTVGDEGGARDRPRADRQALRLPRAQHGHRAAGAVAGALHRRHRDLEAGVAPPAPRGRARRRRRRAGVRRVRHARLELPARWAGARRRLHPRHLELDLDPAAQSQPVHALRRLLRAVRLARDAEPACPRLRDRPLVAARAAVRPRRSAARGAAGGPPPLPDRLLLRHLALPRLGVPGHRRAGLSLRHQGGRHRHGRGRGRLLPGAAGLDGDAGAVEAARPAALQRTHARHARGPCRHRPAARRAVAQLGRGAGPAAQRHGRGGVRAGRRRPGERRAGDGTATSSPKARRWSASPRPISPTSSPRRAPT